MRVVSLVPSWTETLIEAGITVVGRTGYCIHPADKIKDVPVVGGTKNFRLSLLEKIKPDLVIFDREENTKEMFEQCPFAKWSSHITQISDVSPALLELAEIFKNAKLKTYSEQWNKIAQPKKPYAHLQKRDFSFVKHWWREPTGRETQLLYLVWRDPWMCVAPQTFIGSVLSHLGFAPFLPAFADKYPKIDLQNFAPQDTIFLCSSEPYPFAEKNTEFSTGAYAAGLVDGADFSWFGLRTLKFLQTELQLGEN